MRVEQAPEPFSGHVRPVRRVFVVPRGQLDMATVDQLASEIEELVGRRFETVVVDLRATSLLDSSGCLVLWCVCAVATPSGARLRAAGRSTDGAPLARAVGLDLALVARDDLGPRVHGDKSQRPGTGVANLVAHVRGHDGDASG